MAVLADRRLWLHPFGAVWALSLLFFPRNDSADEEKQEREGSEQNPADNSAYRGEAALLRSISANQGTKQQPKQYFNHFLSKRAAVGLRRVTSLPVRLYFFLWSSTLNVPPIRVLNSTRYLLIAGLVLVMLL